MKSLLFTIVQNLRHGQPANQLLVRPEKKWRVRNRRMSEVIGVASFALAGVCRLRHRGVLQQRRKKLNGITKVGLKDTWDSRKKLIFCRGYLKRRGARWPHSQSARLRKSTPERAVWVLTLSGDIVLCSQAGHFTLTVPLSTQVYKWIPANLMLGVTLRWTSIPSRGEQKYSQSLHATETGISPGLVCHNWLVYRLYFTSPKKALGLKFIYLRWCNL